MTLFEEESSPAEIPPTAPLALRMRPRTPEEFVGQEHFFGPGKLLRRMLEADRLASVIFYGPPGTGKSALAHVIAGATRAHWQMLNATAGNVRDARDAIASARQRLAGRGARTVLFVDELHRFNRAQQDVLLPDVENGTILLIAATTMNPFFAINSPLLSRSQVFEFKPLSVDEVVTILRRAAEDRDRGLGKLRMELRDDALRFLAVMADGDARRALNALEVAAMSGRPQEDGRIVIDMALAAESIQRKALVYDRDEDQHYDTASAFIKSMRGSDPDAAVYWLAKMLEGGEDPRFIARRMVIFASEDIANAQPNALVLATSAMQAVEFVGMPEARIVLAHVVCYLACCPKSNATYTALTAAAQDVREGRTLPVPEHLRDAHYKGAERLGHGKGYQYAHNFEGHWVDQEYVPTDKVYYEPTDIGAEKQIKERLEEWRRKRLARQVAEAIGRMTPAERAARSEAVRRAFFELPESRFAVVMGFISMADEVEMRPILAQLLAAGRRVYVPRTIARGRKMIPLRLADLDHLREGYYGILEPVGGENCAVSEIDLVLVPGRAFDREGNRLGRGAGYYDRFMTQPGFRAVRCGIGFACQVLPAVPHEAWDVPLDMLVTEDGVVPRSNANTHTAGVTPP